MSGLTIAVLLVMGVHALVIFGGVLMQRREPAGTIAWILALVLLPGLGLLIYLGVGRPRARRWQHTHHRIAGRVAQAMAATRANHPCGGADEPASPPRTEALVGLARHTSGAVLSHENLCTVLPSAAATYAELERAFEAAEDHIHLLFYIFQPDVTGQALRDHLALRAGSGVRVRVLVDAVGSHRTGEDFWEPLVSAGGEVAVFGRPSWWSHVVHRDRVDYRNHRKIVVTDGRVGFTGGINIGREYLGLNPEIGHWRDSHVRVEGPAVLSLQQAFVEDWCLATGDLLDAPNLFPSPSSEPRGDDAVLVVPSVPGLKWSPLRALYGQAIATARERIWITNPYFIPGRFIRLALETAALRGVDVRLLLPARSDHRLVALASRGIYEELLESGVQIFEYEFGFVHAKTLVIDHWVGSIGSANMDMRSFELNFELNVFVFGPAFSQDLAGHFVHDLEHARPVTVEDVRQNSYGTRLLMAGARLLSALL